MKWRFWLPQHPPQPASCAPIEPLLSLYCDGMASAGETNLVESHLQACEDCRRALEWMQATQLVISRRPLAVPPPDLRMRIARSIAEAGQAARPPRPARRPFVLRPVFLTAAAAAMLGAFGVLIVTAPPTPGPVVTARPALGTHRHVPVPHSGASMTAQAADLRPRKIPRVADMPPKLTTVVRTPGGSHPATVHEAQRTAEPSLPLRDVSPAETAPAHKDLRPASVVPPGKATRLAAKPKEMPQVAAPAPMKKTVIATRLPEIPVNRNSEKIDVPSSPELAPPAQTIEAAHPAEVRVAVVTLAVTRPAHEDVLSNVRASLVTLKSATFSRKIYRNDSTHVQTAAYSPGSKFVQAAINWTPTSLDVSK